MIDLDEDENYEELNTALESILYDDRFDIEYRKSLIGSVITRCYEMLEEIEQEYY